MRREQKLQWQSWIVLAAVAPWCVIAVAWHTTSCWEVTTQVGLGISAAFTWIVWRARAATPPAALLGGLICATLALAPLGSRPLRALPALVAVFALTFAATRFGRGRKQAMGLAEDKQGRDSAQVAANLGIAGLSAAAALSFSSLGFRLGSYYAVMVVASLAEATADTLSSELGEVIGGRPFLITTLQRVAPGTDGGVSLSGTLAGAGGALVVVLIAAVSLGLNQKSALCAGLGGIGGLFFDSLLGATLERRGWLNNDAVNFLSTLAAAGLAWILFTGLG